MSSHVANTVGVKSKEEPGERECEGDYGDGGEEQDGAFVAVLLPFDPRMPEATTGIQKQSVFAITAEEKKGERTNPLRQSTRVVTSLTN